MAAVVFQRMRRFLQGDQVVEVSLHRRNELAGLIHEVQLLPVFFSCPDGLDHHHHLHIISRSISLLTLRNKTPFHHLFLRNEKKSLEEHQCLLSLRPVIVITIRRFFTCFSYPRPIRSRSTSHL